MAKVYSAPKEWGWDEAFNFDPKEDWKVWTARQDAKMAEIEAQYPVIRFQVADGYAQYAVYSRKPLQLIHIPYGDAYQADPILLRGLRASDVTAMLEREKRLKKLFAGAAS